MKIHIITKDQLDENNNYIGSVNLENFEGHLESEENLGCVKFRSLDIKGYIAFKAGSGIEAALGIRAGWGIEVGLGIKAGWGIEAGRGIKTGWGIKAKTCIWQIPTVEDIEDLKEKSGILFKMITEIADAIRYKK